MIKPRRLALLGLCLLALACLAARWSYLDHYQYIVCTKDWSNLYFGEEARRWHAYLRRLKRMQYITGSIAVVALVCGVASCAAAFRLTKRQRGIVD